LLRSSPKSTAPSNEVSIVTNDPEIVDQIQPLPEAAEVAAESASKSDEPEVVQRTAVKVSPSANCTPSEDAASQTTPVSSGSNSPRKRALDEMMAGDRSDVQSLSAAKSSDVTSPPKRKGSLKRSSSVRLAFTADGAVKVKTSDSPSPSPPKIRASAPAKDGERVKLTRSVSMFDNGTTFRDPAQIKSSTPNFGRSRDARTWEFYCDSSPKNLLVAAEAERKGSAVSAINLIRANSSRSRNATALSPRPSKANPKIKAPAGTAKKQMVRAHSSLARLQVATGGKKPFDGGDDDQNDENQDPFWDDGDKENWAPGTTTSVHPLRHTGPSRFARTGLGANGLDVSSAPYRAPPTREVHPDCRSKTKLRTQSKRPENVQADDQQESPNKVADLDCVQGLLSLSQGAWR
jgi:hypothetical protein